jgi:hypothetical protein
VAIGQAVGTDLLDGASSARAARWTRALRVRLEREGVVAVRVSELGLDAATARRLAVAVVGELRSALVEAGLPASARVEADRVQSTHVPRGAGTRTLLPHHDGGHCSYLTPSIHHVPAWDPCDRSFSDAGYCTTAAHKLYQGIFVVDPGEAASVTTYYPWLRLVQHAYSRQTGRRPSLLPVAVWLGANIAAARRERGVTGALYPPIGACLGASSRAARWFVPHCAEAELPPEELARSPELGRMGSSCACTACAGPTGRVLCGILEETLGLTWAELRRRFELRVRTRRHDLVVGHNLMLVHGGADGGPSRRVEPISIVVAEPAGAGYEAWLAREWERWTSGAAALPPSTGHPARPASPHPFQGSPDRGIAEPERWRYVARSGAVR